jgi:beta-lactamase regulating signal transducer with metallopeptidase domain
MTAWLLTWLAQGLALTFVASVILQLMPSLNAATRYAIWWANLGAICLPAVLSAAAALGAEAEALGAKAGATYLFEVPAAPEPAFAIFVGVWLAVALLMLVRIVPGIHAVFTLRDRCREFPPAVEAQLPLWRDAHRRQGARPTRLMLCDAVGGATMLGFLRPYIAVPSSLLKALTRDELDQVVLHEHAHAQRRDDWGKLAQALLQSALWVHPAIAIIGRRLNLEREIACDEWVVASSGLPKVYARCLMRAAEVRNRVSMQLLLGQSLFARKRDLRLRVDRLLALKGHRRGTASLAAVFAGVCAVSVVAAQLRAIPLVGEALEPLPLPSVQSTPEAQAHVAHNEPTSVATRRTHEPPNPGTAESAFALRATSDKPTNSRTLEPANLQTYEPTNPRTGASASAPSDLAEMPVPLAARSFEGRYITTEPTVAIAENRAPWGTFAALGTEVGATARKTSVGLATTFTRASVSLARRF